MGRGATLRAERGDGRAMLLGLAGLSAGAVLAALGFQYIWGLEPCVLCHWQRIPHLAVVAFATAGLVLPEKLRQWTLALCALAFVIGSGIALYHVGVEQRWWAGTAACEGALPPAATVEELRKALLARAPARCDEVAWSFLGLSMAGWNGLLSLAGAALSAAGFVRSRHGAAT